MDQKIIPSERLPYESPVLVEYGSLADLTLTASSGGFGDSGPQYFSQTSKA
jgi:hypothetical protein